MMTIANNHTLFIPCGNAERKIINLSCRDEGLAFITVLILMLIVILIVSSVIFVGHLQYRFIRRDAIRLQAMYLAEAGIYQSLADDREFDVAAGTTASFHKPSAERTFRYPEGGTAQVIIHPWGGFLRLDSKVDLKGQTATVRALVGQKIPDAFGAAVILDRIDYPLVVAGETSITGDAYVGRNGVREGVIHTEPYKGAKLVDGQIVKSDKSLFPEFDPNLLSQSLSDIEDLLKEPAKGRVYYNSLTIDTANDSLLGDGKNLFVYGDLNILQITAPNTIPSCTLTVAGNLNVYANIRFSPWTALAAGKAIHLAGCQFSKVLLMAHDSIHIASGCSGDAQLLSRGKIVLEGGANLTWPSLVYVETDEPAKDIFRPRIVLEPGSRIVGSVILWSPRKTSIQEQDLFVIHKGAEVHGLVFTNDWLDISGTVSGCAAAGSIYLYVSPTTYVNWMYNAVINRTQLESDFVLPIGFAGSSDYTEISWQQLKQIDTL